MLYLGFLLLTDGAISFYYVPALVLTVFNAILIFLKHSFPVTPGRIVFLYSFIRLFS